MLTSTELVIDVVILLAAMTQRHHIKSHKLILSESENFILQPRVALTDMHIVIIETRANCRFRQKNLCKMRFCAGFGLLAHQASCWGLREIPTVLSGSLDISHATALRVLTPHNRQRAMSIAQLLSAHLESEHYQPQSVARMLQPDGTKQANDSGQSIACLHRRQLVWSFACSCLFKRRVRTERELHAEKKVETIHLWN